MSEAIGDRFHAILVDNGVMRKDECKTVKATLTEKLGINLTVVDASELFLGKLKGVSCFLSGFVYKANDWIYTGH